MISLYCVRRGTSSPPWRLTQGVVISSSLLSNFSKRRVSFHSVRVFIRIFNHGLGCYASLGIEVPILEILSAPCAFDDDGAPDPWQTLEL